jgi:poly-gamma-glutamate capsule biosynthesis protein CapA/YwtB (metallophosphatase superfamily)
MRRMAAVAVALALGFGPSRPAETGPVELWIGGDVHLGSGSAGALHPLAAELAGAVGIVNLEGPVGEVPPREGGERLINAPSMLALLVESGVHVIGLANNHATDLGPSGYAETASSAARAGLVPAGGPAGPAVLALGGRRIVVTAHDLSGGPPPRLAAELGSARANADLLVATFHVTAPPSYLPEPSLRAAVELALAAGARVIAAHGTHALGPVERRDGAVIAWGLGNLLFACDCTDEVDAMVLRVALDGEVVRASVVPVDAGLRGRAARPSHDPELIFQLLEAIGSSPLERRGAVASF